MSPPAATTVFESASPINGNGLTMKKDLAVKAAANGQAKTLAEMAEKWESFTFAPIRESQVSRAMSTFPLPLHCPIQTNHTQPAATSLTSTLTPSPTLSSSAPGLAVYQQPTCSASSDQTSKSPLSKPA